MAENLAHAESNSGVIDKGALQRFVERLEVIDEELSGLREDRKEIVKATMDAYRSALGMLSDTPLGEAAVVEMRDLRGRARPPRD
jgi:hypothetical protein